MCLASGRDDTEPGPGTSRGKKASGIRCLATTSAPTTTREPGLLATDRGRAGTAAHAHLLPRQRRHDAGAARLPTWPSRGAPGATSRCAGRPPRSRPRRRRRSRSCRRREPRPFDRRPDAPIQLCSVIRTTVRTFEAAGGAASAGKRPTDNAVRIRKKHPGDTRELPPPGTVSASCSPTRRWAGRTVASWPGAAP